MNAELAATHLCAHACVGAAVMREASKLAGKLIYTSLDTAIKSQYDWKGMKLLTPHLVGAAGGEGFIFGAWR